MWSGKQRGLLVGVVSLAEQAILEFMTTETWSGRRLKIGELRIFDSTVLSQERRNLLKWDQISTWLCYTCKVL